MPLVYCGEKNSEKAFLLENVVDMENVTRCRCRGNMAATDSTCRPDVKPDRGAG
jgi:hypothetical protein